MDQTWSNWMKLKEIFLKKTWCWQTWSWRDKHGFKKHDLDKHGLDKHGLQTCTRGLRLTLSLVWCVFNLEQFQSFPWIFVFVSRCLLSTFKWESSKGRNKGFSKFSIENHINDDIDRTIDDCKNSCSWMDVLIFQLMLVFS